MTMRSSVQMYAEVTVFAAREVGFTVAREHFQGGNGLAVCLNEADHLKASLLGEQRSAGKK